MNINKIPVAHNTFCCCFFPLETWINLIMSDAQDKLGGLLFCINSFYGLLKFFSCSYSERDSSDLPKPTSPSYFHDKVLMDSSSACSVSMLSCFSSVRVFATLWTIACQVPVYGGSPGKNTGMGCHDLLQGIFPTQGWKTCLSCFLHWQMDSFTTTATWEAPVCGSVQSLSRV